LLKQGAGFFELLFSGAEVDLAVKDVPNYGVALVQSKAAADGRGYDHAPAFGYFHFVHELLHFI
jgi:hypothetical protein